MTATAALHAGFRAAARALEAADPAKDGPEATRERLVLHEVRGGTRWIDDALRRGALLQGELAAGRGPVGEDAARWLLACCEGWVLRASGPFRSAADRLAARVEPSPVALPALLRYWRITGRPGDLDRALSGLPKRPGSLVEAEAAWAGFRATGDPALAATVRALLAPLDPADVPVPHWPLLADALDLSAEPFAEAAAAWGDRPPAGAVRAAAAVALPPLRVRVDWWYDSDLQGGPVAEAATFPYPALRLRFARLDLAAQARVTATLGEVRHPPLDDIGVVAAFLASLVAEVDRTPFREGTGRRRRGGLLRR